jgi:hypothetical protein
MNWETILVAAIAALGPLLGTILTIKQQNRLIDYRMGQVESSIKSLSAKVDKHNNFDRRLIVIETKLGIETPKEKAS